MVVAATGAAAAAATIVGLNPRSSSSNHSGERTLLFLNDG